MAKKITVIQDGTKECGSACLLSLIRYYGGNMSINRIIELTKTNKDGTNFYNLKTGAEEMGLTGKAYKVDSINKLYEIDIPFISQVVINNYYHFVVVYKFKNNKITIMDPAKGMLTTHISEFNRIWTGYILLLEPFKNLPIYEEENYLVKVIKELIYKNKIMLINLMLLTTIMTIFTCLYSYHFKIIIDYIIDTDNINLLTITIIFIIILAIKKMTEYLRNNLLLYLNQKIDLEIITTTINKIISLPYSYYKNKTTGEIISRVNDLFYLKNVITKIITTFSFDILLAFISLMILFNINQKMTLFLLLITIFYGLIFLSTKNIIKNSTDNIQNKTALVNSLLIESINSYETIKGLNLENYFKKKNSLNYLDMINSHMNLNKIVYSSEFIKDIIEGITIIYIIYLGTSYVINGTISLGSLITYNSLIYYYLNPIRNIFDFYKEIYYVKNSLTRINNILNYKYEKLDKKTNLEVSGDINLVNLNFNYLTNKTILKNINLDIPKNTKLLILGQSGTGKSTLLKILYRYYEIERGMLFINNYDINDFSLFDIRNNITYIHQQETLYTDTIRNNIILDRDIKEKEFIDICNLTYVNEIVKKSKLSYDMPLEENGANLSGGERQRIILARSLLKKSNFILIDEGLNEIDIDLERKILMNIFNNYKDKTIIIISHRLANIDLFDKVVSLQNGQVKGVYVKRE